MDTGLQLLIESLLLGGFYSFMAVGFALIWGVLNILNLAYGSYIILGAYLSLFLFRYAGLDPILSIPVSFATGFLFGILVQKLIFNRAMKLEPFMVLIISFGLDVLISNALNLLFKADVRSINVSYGGDSFLLGEVIISKVKLLVFVLSLLLTFALYLFLNRTWTGKAIRAVALDKDGAMLVGIDPSKIFLITAGLGTAISFSSGNLYGILQGFTPFDGGLLTVKVFLISILGGLGRIESAVAGGFLLAFIEIFSSFYMGEGWKLFVALAVMVGVLIFRPRGLLGSKYYGEAQ